ncbi:potassium transporter TrkG [Roseburia hominis]
MMKKRKNIRFSTVQLMAAGFMGLIFLGGVLLWLPISNTRPIAFVDALFTAATAVCVTGLVTVTPAVQFTLFGKIVLLILIQIGGLGIIACVTAFFLIMRKRISLKERIIIQESYSMESLSGMVAMVIRILKGTFAVEAAGAILYAIQFIPEFGVAKGIWYAIFHAVSAFCNAGVDILGNSSFIRYAGNPLICVTTMLLIVLSGLGFPVWQDLVQNIRLVWKKNLKAERAWGKLRLHTKIVLVMTLILIMSGALGFLVMEYSNPDTIGAMPFWKKGLNAFFHSISTRTAGFATVPQGALESETMFTTCILMFIGGSPGGTAGGVKTTTIAMLCLACMTFIRGGEDTECFGRRIEMKQIRTGMCIVLFSFAVLLLGTTVVASLEGEVSFIRVLYETTSAIGTVGLTADLTPQLCMASKVVIMLLMYLGRIGPITLALAFGVKKNQRDKIRRLPSEGIMVG